MTAMTFSPGTQVGYASTRRTPSRTTNRPTASDRPASDRPASHRPASHRPTRLTRRGRCVVVGTLLAALCGAGAFAGHAEMAAAGSRPTVEHVTVRSGETLWQLAERIAPNADPRVVVAELEAVNHLPSGNIRAGQRLAVSGLSPA